MSASLRYFQRPVSATALCLFCLAGATLGPACSSNDDEVNAGFSDGGLSAGGNAGDDTVGSSGGAGGAVGGSSSGGAMNGGGGMEAGGANDGGANDGGTGTGGTDDGGTGTGGTDDGGAANGGADDGGAGNGGASDGGAANGGSGGTPTSADGTLVFTEYVEGDSGNIKALEVTNVGVDAIDLSDCFLERYQNGSLSSPVALGSSMLGAGESFVICNNASDIPGCDEYNTNVQHNGDDSYELKCDGTVLDTFGQSVASDYAKDVTMRRKCDGGKVVPVTGLPASFNASGWDEAAAVNDVSDLGAFSCD